MRNKTLSWINKQMGFWMHLLFSMEYFPSIQVPVACEQKRRRAAKKKKLYRIQDIPMKIVTVVDLVLDFQESP